ncbi:MAG: DUF4258 domain-containing protein [Candidatus Margulisbacteria bacterium]|nr:DUF4258 domain-containing protein [Candidatus Margulisiibacteriota bacterium]
MKPIEFSQHALDQLADRGATKEEVIRAIEQGEEVPAKKGRTAFRKNFSFESKWKGKFYEVKQVMPIVVDENDKYVVITVFTYYFGGESK